MRGVLPANDGISQEIEIVEYPLQELKRYFDSDPSSTLNEKSSYIFAWFAKDRFKELVALARNIDEEYANDSELELPVDNSSGQTA